MALRSVARGLSALLLLGRLGLAAEGPGPEEEDEVSLLQSSQRVTSPLASASRVFPRNDLASHANVPVPSLVVNLDAPPEVRWRNVTRYYMAMGVYPDCCNDNHEHLEIFRPLLDAMPLSEEYRRELQGIIADVNDPSLTADDLILKSLGYELSGRMENPAEIFKRAAKLLLANTSQVGDKLQRILDVIPMAAQLTQRSGGCSAVLAAMPNGTVVHGRNMDYGGFEVVVNGTALHWPEVTSEVIFTKGGEPLFLSVHWPGTVGIHTGMRFGGWSFEQNTRFHGVITDVLYGMLRGSEGFMYRVRRTMETTPDFEAALQKLYDANMMSPMYFIMAGAKPFEGAVLTMDRGGQHMVPARTPPPIRLSNGSTAAGAGWYLVQTNDDQGKTPWDSRRPLEMQRLSTARQDMVSPDWMWSEVLSSALYNTGTVFTSVFVPATGYHKTLVHPGNGGA